jgi:flagellar hook protein FlgE
MGSFSTPLSGLTAAQSQLQSVSNNLANIDTIGYKDQSVSFSDIFSASSTTNGSGDPVQTGSGVSVAATNSNFTDGSLSSTETASNMALSGNGFFVTKSSSGSQEYTRSGDFTTNSAGQLTTANGELVQGYPSVNGVVNTSSALQPLKVSSVISPAVASTTVGITANLASGTAVGDTAASSSLPIYDSLGTSHTLTVSYTKTAANTWTYTASVPSSDITGGTGTTTTVGSGTLNFDTSGALSSITNVVPISVPTLADGATSPLTVSGPFGTASNPTITQTSLASATSATSTDGFASGTLSSYSVSSDGTIEGKFSSGSTLALGQVAVASFANTQGLVSIGNNAYQPSSASGSAVVGVAGTGGRGTITGGSVESSNVDIATEFAKLIVAQQAYSANAKTVTAFNQVSQATIAMLQ